MEPAYKNATDAPTFCAEAMCVSLISLAVFSKRWNWSSCCLLVSTCVCMCVHVCVSVCFINLPCGFQQALELEELLPAGFCLCVRVCACVCEYVMC